MAIAQQGLTLKEFLALPEAEPALEYWLGGVIQKVSPRLRHGRIQFTLCQRFDDFAKPRKLGLAVPEVRTTFGGSSVVPDVSFYTWDQLPLDANGELLDESPHPPAIAIEVTSPGQSIRTLAERCQWYVDHGVRVSLLVQLRRRLVTVFRVGVSPCELHDQDRIDLDDVLPGFALTVAELFAALKPR